MSDEEKATDLKKPEEVSWGWFLLETQRLDEFHDKPNGWHWAMAFSELSEHIPNLNLTKIQNLLPDGHWFKQKDTEIPTYLTESLSELTSELGTLETNDVIDFSNLNFRKSDFVKQVDFSNFIFPIEVSFANTKFPDDANFNGAIFSGNANFENATFKKYATFKNAHFSTYTNFKRAKFELHAPQFYGAKFNTEIFWTGIELPELKRATDSETDEQYNARILNNQSAYENLTTKLDNQKKYHDQHFFFRKEMRCRRELEHGLIKPFYWLYEKLADYGYGIGWALLYWFLHICFWTGILYLFVFCSKGFSEGLKCSFITSITNAHSFLLSKGMSMTSCYNTHEDTFVFNLIWAGEAILGAMFLFLILLTLRVRFRLR